jgi:hypothetical protein
MGQKSMEKHKVKERRLHKDVCEEKNEEINEVR